MEGGEANNVKLQSQELAVQELPADAGSLGILNAIQEAWGGIGPAMQKCAVPPLEHWITGPINPQAVCLGAYFGSKLSTKTLSKD